MESDERKSFKEKAYEIIDMHGENAISTISELFLEGALGAVVPGAAGVIFSYRQKRTEKNLLRLIKELQDRINIIEELYKKMSDENKSVIKDFFSGLICDYVIDEQEEEKIKYIANGFVSLSGQESINIDQTIIYLDILKNLRLIDIRILSDKSKRIILYGENFQDYLDILGITNEQYRMINDKLLRLGLYKSSYDDEYQKLVKNVNDITEYVTSLQKGKPKRLRSNINSFKPKDRESITISKLGIGFVNYFLGVVEENTN